VCPPGKNATQALREIDELHGTEFAPLVDELIAGDWRADWSDACDNPRGGEAQVQVLREILGHGLTIAQTARLLSLTPLMVARCLSNTEERANQLLAAEPLLRAGELPHNAIAARIGVPAQAVHRMGQTLGCMSPAAARRQAGGGWVHDEQAYRRIAEMSHCGMSSGQIARELGMSRNTVKSVLYRAKKQAA
jgi:DNA-binding CsgD family transcriptional regulator